MKKTNKINKILTIALALCVLSIAAMPLITDDSSAEEIEVEQTLALSNPVIGALDFISGFMTGFGVAVIIGLLGDPDDDDGGDQEGINQAMRLSEVNKVIYSMDTAKNLISTVLPADAELWNFTSPHWQRTAEYATTQYWTIDGNYDPIPILDTTLIHPNTSNYLYSWSAAIENAYNSSTNYSTKWTNEAYSSINLSLSWNGGSVSGGTPATESSKITIDVCQITTPTSSKNRVYIDNDSPLGNLPEIDHSQYDRIHIFGQSSVNITNITTGMIYKLNPGSNNLASVYNTSTQVNEPLPSGYYTLATGATYAGPITQVDPDSTSAVRGGMVVMQGTNLYYIIPNGDNRVYVYNSLGSLQSNSASLQFSINFDGREGNTTKTSEMLNNNGINIIREYDNLISSINNVITRTCNAAEAIWDIFDICEESSIWISPSSVTTNIPGYSMIVPEIEAVYIQQMKQVAQLYLDNKTALDESVFVTNVESLALHCYGDLYLNGQLWAENIVFTPYITTADQHLQIGMNEWGGSGFAMIWAQVDNYSEWNGQPSISSYATIDLSGGYSIDLKRIVSHGQSVNNIDLTRYVIQKHNTGGSDGGQTPTPVPQVLDAKTLIMIIILELAVIFFLLWWRFPTVFWFLLIAIILVIVAVFASGYITRWLL